MAVVAVEFSGRDGPVEGRRPGLHAVGGHTVALPASGRVAANSGSEDRMFAMVARTGSHLRMATSGWHAVRVTHALLFLSATIVSPGVCDACVKRCCDGVSHAAVGARTADAASTVAATHCCGTPAGASCTVADVGDGDQNKGVCPEGDCRCVLAPRASLPVLAGRGWNEAKRDVITPSASLAAIVLPADPLAGSVAGIRAALAAGQLIPIRPVRVLLGVWRI